jgi:signal transduction histidine kinase
MPFVAEAVTSAIRSTAGATVGFVSIIRDITERKRADEALARQHKELEVLNGTKGRFLGIAAHDLRNPLAVVNVSTQILKKNITEPTHLTLLNNIGRSTQKMLALINTLLDVSKIESGKLEIRSEDVDVPDFLRECYSENEMIGSQKGIALVLSVPEDIGHARFDKERMHQAVDNLLSNAFKYSNPNTTVTLGAKRSDRGLEIRVEDQGVGIKDEDLPLLFKEFSKASAQPTGGEPSHGLGLAIVKRVVELQGGSIEAKSNPGGGAIFTITLP